MNMSLYYLVQERLLNNGIISVNTDSTEVEYGHSAAGHVEGIVQLREKLHNFSARNIVDYGYIEEYKSLFLNKECVFKRSMMI